MTIYGNPGASYQMNLQHESHNHELVLGLASATDESLAELRGQRTMASRVLPRAAILRRSANRRAKFNHPDQLNLAALRQERNKLCRSSNDQFRPDQRLVYRDECNADQFIPFHRHRKSNEQRNVLPGETAVRLVSIATVPYLRFHAITSGLILRRSRQFR